MNTFLFTGPLLIALDGYLQTGLSLVHKSLTACGKQETVPSDLSKACNNQLFSSHTFKVARGFKN